MLEAEILHELSRIVGDQNISTEPTELYLYSTDVSVRYQHRPDVVVRPRSVEEISNVVKLASERGIPFTPRGAGSGVAGGAVPIKGGILIDLSGMNKVLEIDLLNRCVTVQAGVVHNDLNEELEKHGFIFPPDPGSSKMCTLGGFVAVGGGGVHTVKYGSVREYVLGLRVVLPTGEIIKTGGKTVKRATGYNLTQLFIGSEGTLGIIAELILKIIPIPESTAVVLAAFNKIEDAARTAINTFSKGIIPAAMELLDKSAIEAVNKYEVQIGLPDVDGILLVEVDGSKEEVKRQAQAIKEICVSEGAVQADWSDDLEKRTKLWKARSVVGVATARLSEKLARIYEGEDITVPISRIVEAVKGVRNVSDKYGIPIVTFGHIGDGNLHPALIIDKNSAEHWKILSKAVAEIHELALTLGGTTSGEHGMGILRAEFMEREHGKVTLNLMRKIKKAFDPDGIMNPGKLDLDESEK